MLRPGLLRSEGLKSPIEKCTFPGDNSGAAEVLTADGTTHSAHNSALLESKSKNWEEMDPNNQQRLDSVTREEGEEWREQPKYATQNVRGVQRSTPVYSLQEEKSCS